LPTVPMLDVTEIKVSVLVPGWSQGTGCQEGEGGPARGRGSMVVGDGHGAHAGVGNGASHS
jgi:hypothetical protein